MRVQDGKIRNVEAKPQLPIPPSPVDEREREGEIRKCD